MKQRYVWVVEIYVKYPVGRWEPTVGIGLTKADALEDCRGWRQRNPGDRFRVRKYQHVQP